MNEPHNGNGNCYLETRPFVFFKFIKKTSKVENVNKKFASNLEEENEKKSKSGKFFLLFGLFLGMQTI